MKQAYSGQTGQPSRSTDSDKSSAPLRWPLAQRRQLSGNQIMFPFSTLQRRGNLEDSSQTPLAISGLPKLIFKASKNILTQKLRERIKRRSSHCSQVQIFCNFLQFAAQFHSSTFVLVSFYLFMMYSHINMLGQKFY